jgi:hypothetical protein
MSHVAMRTMQIHDASVLLLRYTGVGGDFATPRSDPLPSE